MGEGIGWMKLYISFTMPDKVLQLQAVKPNQMRIYKDEQGKVYLQQDPDHAPVSEEEAGGRKATANYNPNTIEFDEFIIINEAGKKLEIKIL